MDQIEERQRLSELTDEALEKNDLKSLKLIKQVVDKDRPITTQNFGEFFYSMVPPEILEQLERI